MLFAREDDLRLVTDVIDLHLAYIARSASPLEGFLRLLAAADMIVVRHAGW